MSDKLRALMNAMYADHVKYPQLRLPDMQARRLDQMCKLLAALDPPAPQEPKP